MNGEIKKVRIKKIFMLCFIGVLCFLSACEHLPVQPHSEYEPNHFYENGYEYEIEENDTIKIISYDDYDELNVTLPEQFAGKPVTTLGKNTFYQHKSTVSIILPSSLTTIEGSPFYRCCSLREIVIPKNICKIECNPFFRSSSLTKITVDPDNVYYTDIDGVLFNKEKTVLISYPEGKPDESYIIPETVKKLNIDSFGYHTRLRRITILSNVTEFPDSAPDSSMFVFPNDITLLVESGSAAEQYAIECDLNYEVI